METYVIRYSHTGHTTADTLSRARDEVRDEAMRVRRTAVARKDVVFVGCDEGVYAYLTQDDADRDADGTGAFAVICPAGDDE